jgi:hypothetical protein
VRFFVRRFSGKTFTDGNKRSGAFIRGFFTPTIDC